MATTKKPRRAARRPDPRMRIPTRDVGVICVDSAVIGEQVKPQSEVDQRVSEVGYAANALDSAISTLEKRLEPVSFPPPNGGRGTPAGDAPPEPMRTPLGAQLELLRDQLHSLTVRVELAMQRLGI